MTDIMIRFGLTAVLAVLTSSNAFAQEIVKGIPPFASMSGGQFDKVNNVNLNVHFSTPVLVKAGRGMPFNYLLRYDSWMWQPNAGAWVPKQKWGWSMGLESLLGSVTYSTTQGSCVVGGNTYYYKIYSNWKYNEPPEPGFSVGYNFTVSDASNGPCTGAPAYSASATATDGSGVTLSVTAQPAATVYFRSGNTSNPPLGSGCTPGTLTDSNGNQIVGGMVPVCIGNTTDTLGTTALTITGGVHTYTTAAGGSATVQVNTASYTVQTNFACSGISEYGPISQDLVSSISLPDGTSYSFTYEVTPGDTHTPHYVTARLASVTLPTGGTISYSYTGGNNGVICADGSAAGLTRTTPDGTWTYTRSGSAPAWTTTMTDPQGNQTVP